PASPGVGPVPATPPSLQQHHERDIFGEGANRMRAIRTPKASDRVQNEKLHWPMISNLPTSPGTLEWPFRRSVVLRRSLRYSVGSGPDPAPFRRLSPELSEAHMLLQGCGCPCCSRRPRPT